MRTRLRGGRDLKRERESDLPDPPVITDINLRGLVELGLKSSKGPEMAFGPGASPEELLQHQAEEERAQEERIKAAEELREEVNRLMTFAYDQGADAAVEKSERTAWNARSVALYLLVFAVVLMPVIAIVAGITPQDFGSYVAPITGIAGTVVGYWFSRGGGSGSGN
jgi:hypothetical protein